MKPLPFRIKIALLSTVISGVVIIGFAITTLLMISRQKFEGLDTEIRSLGKRHPGWITNRRDFQRLDENLGFIFGDNHHNEIILLVKDTHGEVIYTSSSWPKDLNPHQIDSTLAVDLNVPTTLDTSSDNTPPFNGRGWGGAGRGLGPGGGPGLFTKIPKFLTVNSSASQWRLGIMGTDDTTLIIGLNTAQTQSEITSLRNGFLCVLPIALLFVGLGGWLIAGHALRPLRIIAKTAEQVTARGLDQRIPNSHEDPEISRVILVLNRMMDRLENSFQQAIRFSADASHELRTPLAIMQGELENALQEADSGSTQQQVFSNLLEETQRLKTITSGLLLLARADSGQLTPVCETINLSTILETILDDARVIAEESHLIFKVQIMSGIEIQADPSLIRAALLNLLINAVKYNEPGGDIHVDLIANDNQVTLTICNSGQGIPESDQGKVFTRFHRVDRSRHRKVDGIGLGLSLAREIIRAHDGDLILAESRPGWTIFCISLKR